MVLDQFAMQTVHQPRVKYGNASRFSIHTNHMGTREKNLSISLTNFGFRFISNTITVVASVSRITQQGKRKPNCSTESGIHSEKKVSQIPQP